MNETEGAPRAAPIKSVPDGVLEASDKDTPSEPRELQVLPQSSEATTDETMELNDTNRSKILNATVFQSPADTKDVGKPSKPLDENGKESPSFSIKDGELSSQQKHNATKLAAEGVIRPVQIYPAVTQDTGLFSGEDKYVFPNGDSNKTGQIKQDNYPSSTITFSPATPSLPTPTLTASPTSHLSSILTTSSYKSANSTKQLNPLSISSSTPFSLSTNNTSETTGNHSVPKISTPNTVTTRLSIQKTTTTPVFPSQYKSTFNIKAMYIETTRTFAQYPGQIGHTAQPTPPPAQRDAKHLPDTPYNASNASILLTPGIHGVEPDGGSGGGGGTSAALIVPAVCGSLFILTIIIVMILIHKRKKLRPLSFRKINGNTILSYSPQEESMTMTDETQQLYAKVDKSKKRRIDPNESHDELDELVPLSDLQSTASADEVEAPEPDDKDNVDNVTGERIEFVDNDLYEPAEEGEGTALYTSANEPKTEMNSGTSPLLDKMNGVRNSLLVPLPTRDMQCEESDSSDSELETLPDKAPSPPKMIRQSQPGEYVEPSCHDHPQPGPHWKPFHEYDPVYVPQNHPSRQIDNFVDNANYIKGRARAESVNPYEEIQFVGDTQGVPPPSQNTALTPPVAHATSVADNVPPVAPRRRESREGYRPPPKRPSFEDDKPPVAPERRESKRMSASSQSNAEVAANRKETSVLPNNVLEPVVENFQGNGSLLNGNEDSGDIDGIHHEYTSVDPNESPSDNGVCNINLYKAEAAMTGDNKDELYEPIEFNQ